LLIDKQSLSEPSAEIVGTHISKVLLVGFLRRSFGCTFHHISNTPLSKVNEWVVSVDLFGILISVDSSLDGFGEIGITWLSSISARILSRRHAEAVVLSIVSSLDVVWRDLWNLEGAKTNVSAELDDQIVAVICGMPTELFELVVG
jgi:hypothetical protein